MKPSNKQNSTYTKIEKRERIIIIIIFFFFLAMQFLAIFPCSSYMWSPILQYLPEHYTHTERERGWSKVFLEVFYFGAVCVRIGCMEKVGNVILTNLPKRVPQFCRACFKWKLERCFYQFVLQFCPYLNIYPKQGKPHK